MLANKIITNVNPASWVDVGGQSGVAQITRTTTWQFGTLVDAIWRWKNLSGLGVPVTLTVTAELNNSQLKMVWENIANGFYSEPFIVPASIANSFWTITWEWSFFDSQNGSRQEKNTDYEVITTPTPLSGEQFLIGHLNEKGIENESL